MTWALALIALIAVGCLYGAVRFVIAIHDGRQSAILLRAIAAEERLLSKYDPYITQALVDEAEYLVSDQDQAMRIGNSWPCDHENGWCVGECLEPPRGKHHVVHTITDLPEPSDPWWTK